MPEITPPELPAEAAITEEELLQARLYEAETKLAIRTQEAAAAREQAQALSEKATGQEQELNELRQTLAVAVSAYREMVCQANPDIPADLVTGEGVDEIRASLEQGRTLVNRIREEMEAELSHSLFPAGSPPRRQPDLSVLSARDKIRQAMGAD